MEKLLAEKLKDAENGAVVELSVDETEALGLVQEHALDYQDALDAMYDECEVDYE